jgi:hypothetical protein
MYGCLIALLIFIVMPFILVAVTLYRNIMALSGRYKRETEKKEKEGRKKKEQWQSHEEGPHAPRDPKKIIQDDEGEYIDFEEE